MIITSFPFPSHVGYDIYTLLTARDFTFMSCLRLSPDFMLEVNRDNVKPWTKWQPPIFENHLHWSNVCAWAGRWDFSFDARWLQPRRAEGGSWKVPAPCQRCPAFPGATCAGGGVGWGRTGSVCPPTYGGFWDLCFWGSMAAEGLRRPAGLRDPVRLGSNPPPLLNARSCTQSHLNKAVLLLLGQPTCCPSELRSTQSCLYREAYFSMQKYISPRWFFQAQFRIVASENVTRGSLM